MTDFDVLPLYPKELEKNEKTAEMLWDAACMASTVAEMLRDKVNECHPDQNERAFCLALDIGHKKVEFWSDSFNISIDENRRNKLVKVGFYNSFEWDYSYERPLPDLEADVGISYEEKDIIKIAVNGKINEKIFSAETHQKYDDLLPFRKISIELTPTNGEKPTGAVLYITSMIHALCNSDNVLKVLDKVMKKFDHPYVTLHSFKTGWTNYFGMPKYIPPRNAIMFNRSELEADEDNIRDVLKSINAADFNVLLFSYSIFAMCKSLFNKRSLKPFLINIHIPKIKVSREEQVRIIEKAEKQNVYSGYFEKDINLKTDYYGDDKNLIKKISEIPHCFFKPEQETSNTNKNLVSMDKAFSPASTYERMLNADSDFFSSAEFKDFPVVLSGSSKSNIYEEYLITTRFKEYSFLMINRSVPDKIIDSHLKSPLSFILIDADISKNKSECVLNFELPKNFVDINQGYLINLKNNFILYLEHKMYDDLFGFIDHDVSYLSEKVKIIEDEVIEKKYNLFLTTLGDILKAFKDGKRIFLLANYSDTMNIYKSKLYRDAGLSDLYYPFYRDLKNRRSAYKYSFSTVKRLLKAVNISEDEYIKEIICDDADFYMYSKYRDWGKKELKEKRKEKIDTWNDNYTFSLIAKYIAATQHKSDYILKKLKEAEKMLSEVIAEKPLIGNRLKFMLAVVLCFDDYITEEHPKLSYLSRELVEKTIGLHNFLYIKDAENAPKALDKQSAAKTFCKYFSEVKQGSAEQTDCGKFYKLYGKKGSEDHLLGWYDIKHNDYYLIYEGLNQCIVYDCFMQYLKDNNMKTDATFKQILRSLRDDLNVIYTRDNPTGTHYQAKKRIEGEERKVYRIYGSKADQITE